MTIGQPAACSPGTGRSEGEVSATRVRSGMAMKNLLRAGLIVALGLGLNVLCGDAWAEEGGVERAKAIDEDPAAREREARIEAIWSSP